MEKSVYSVKFSCDGGLRISAENIYDYRDVINFVHLRNYKPFINKLQYSYAIDVYKKGVSVLSVKRVVKNGAHYQVFVISKEGITTDIVDRYPSRMCTVDYCARMAGKLKSTYTLKVMCNHVCVYRCTVQPNFTQHWLRG